MALRGAGPFATFLIVGTTCFFLGILFANFPYDYYVLWSTPPVTDPALDPRDPYFSALEDHLKFLHASPPLISRMLHIVIGVGMLGFFMKLYKMTEANMLFDGASLAMYVIGITIYISNIVKGMRTVTAGAYGGVPLAEAGTDAKAPLEIPDSGYVGREDSMRVLAASNTILALVLIGVLVLQAGQWYAQRKEAEEMDQMDKARDEKKAAKAEKSSGKKRQ